MNKFSYRMQNILDIQQKLEDQEKINFAMANNKLEAERQKLAQLMFRKGDYEKKARKALKDKLDIQEIKYTREAIDAMRSAIRDQMIVVHTEEKNVEAARQKLAQVRRERQTHEKLKEYAFEAYKQEYAAEEAKEIDQSVSFRYTAQSR